MSATLASLQTWAAGIAARWAIRKAKRHAEAVGRRWYWSAKRREEARNANADYDARLDL